jgi:hypothetical protein
LKAHGGYLCRVENFDSVDLAALAREALRLDGGSVTGSLGLSWIQRRKVACLSFDLRARRGEDARWFEERHALARLLSERFRATTVHAYAYLPDRLEQVVAYGGGRQVGGERVRYDDVELDFEGMDDAAFEAIQSRWPLGHLAYVFGVTRAQLLSLGAQTPSTVIALDASQSDAA